jgi:benzodiazapine receptor
MRNSPSTLVALALLQGALLLPIKAFQVPANAFLLSAKLTKSSSLAATHRHPNNHDRRRAILSEATSYSSSSSTLSSTVRNDDPFSSPKLDTDALVKYALSAIAELTLFGVTFQLLDVAQAQFDARLPFPAVAFLFYACSLKSRFFNPLNNQRPDISKAVEGGGSSGFRDRVMPSWTPPGVIFPIMWLLIIGPIRAYSSAVVVTTAGSFLTLPTMAFILHLTVGDVWNTINNTEKRYGASVVCVLCVVLSAANAAYQYSTVDPLAGKLLGGTCLWLVTAAALITDTWRLNPTANGDRVPLYPVRGEAETSFIWGSNEE